MIELHVLGIGSPFGDDQLGWEVLRLLQQRTRLSHYIPQQLCLTCCDRPGMHLLELMRHAKNVFLIDAVKTGSSIGTLHSFENEEIEEIRGALSTHAIGVADVIKMGSILHNLPQQVILYGIEIGDVSVQFKITEPIILAIKKLSLRIEQDIMTFLARLSST